MKQRANIVNFSLPKRP